MIAFNAEKREANGVPLSILREIIRHGNGTLTDYLAKLGVFSKDDFEQQAVLNFDQQTTTRSQGLNLNIEQHKEIIVDRDEADSSVSMSYPL